MKKFSEILIILCFIVFIGNAALFTAGHVKNGTDYSFYENRALTHDLDASVENVMNGKFFTDLENYLVDRSGARSMLTELSTRIDLDAVRRPVVNGVVVRRDILLGYHDEYSWDIDKLPEQAAEITSNLKSVSDAVESYGGHYCYVAVPSQFDVHAASYPWYIGSWHDYSLAEAREMKKAASAAGVDFLDLSGAFKADGMPDSYSSRVDLHYSMYGAFKTYKEIMREFEKMSGRNLHPMTDDDVEITPVKSSYLGSWERSLMGLRKLNEPLYRLDAKKPVNFTLTENGKEMTPQVYYGPADPNGQVTYEYYMNGNVAEGVIDTHRSWKPSVLIYGDSFTNPLECFMYNSFDRMYTLDLRYYTGGTLTDYVKKYKPDYVVCVRNYGHVTEADGNGGK